MNPMSQLLEPEIRELIQQGKYAELRESLKTIPPADVADVLATMDPSLAAVAFRFLPREEAGDVFSFLDADSQEEIIEELGASAVRVVEGMDPDDRAKVLEELPSEVAQRLIASLSPEDRRETQAILGYPPESVGRLMTPDYVRVRPEWTVGEAIEHIRRFGRDAETVNVIYVVDERGRLIDDLRLRQFLLASPDQTVESLMDRSYVALRADQDQEEAVKLMGRYDRIALPVVDSQGALVGIVTFDDVADVAEQEVTEDIHKLGGVEVLETPYLQANSVTMFRKRWRWLAVLFIGQTVTVLVLSGFEEQLDKVVALTLFIPLVISCGGNSGSQAATLVTRALALGQVRPLDWLRIVSREILTGTLLGAALGLLGVVSYFIFHFTGIATSTFPLQLGLTIGLAVAAVVLWGTTAGSLLPLILKNFGFDPGVASTPLVATLMDATGMLIYFSIAIVLLTGRLL